MSVYLLSDELAFPPASFADENGLLAVGGDLSRERLLLAYKSGIFPWFSEDEPLLWWSPDPRLVVYPDEIRISKSLRKLLRKDKFKITVDKSFKEVISLCSSIREENGEGTWIVSEMIDSYTDLHNEGFAHSIETWYNDELVGGLYGISLGKCFFGESMFSKVSNASKVAFVALSLYLKELNFDLIDCQVTTDHLLTLGAVEIPRESFLSIIEKSLQLPTYKGKWNSEDLKKILKNTFFR